MSLLRAGYVLIMLLVVGGVLYALIRGGRDERIAALALIAGVILTEIAGGLSGTRWREPEYGVMAVDAALLAFLMWLALRSERFWPLWSAAAQLVGTLTHIGFLMQESIVATAYATTQPMWVVPLVAAIAVGTWNYRLDPPEDAPADWQTR